MNKILFENKVKVLERLVLQDIVANYGMKKSSETSYDNLMAKLLDRMTGFYEQLELDNVSSQRLNQYGDRAKIYTEQLRADLDKAAEVTVRQIVKQLPREKLSVATQWDVIQAVRPVLRKRMEVLRNLLSTSALQMKNYMLLWDYQDTGFNHYCLLTEGENCDDCNNLEGQVFPISEARVGENFPPMHPNCNCRVGILNGTGQVAYIISEGKSEKKEEETNWYDAFLRMPQDAKELFLAFVRAQNERLGQKDIAGFLDWLTMGIVSGTLEGYENRYQKLLNEPTLYNFVNYLTSGLADTVKGAIKPEEPLSLQHWLDTLGVVSIAFGAYQTGKTAGNITKKGSRTRETIIEFDGAESDFIELYKAGVPSKRNASLQTQLAYVIDGEKQFIPKNTQFDEVITIAGTDVKTQIRNVDKLIKKYGGTINDWQKRAGKITSDKYTFDVHWYEKDGIQYETKLKYRKENVR